MEKWKVHPLKRQSILYPLGCLLLPLSYSCDPQCVVSMGTTALTSVFSNVHILLPQSKELLVAFFHFIGVGDVFKKSPACGATIQKQQSLLQDYACFRTSQHFVIGPRAPWQPFCGWYTQYPFSKFHRCPQHLQGELTGSPRTNYFWLALIREFTNTASFVLQPFIYHYYPG